MWPKMHSIDINCITLQSIRKALNTAFHCDIPNQDVVSVDYSIHRHCECTDTYATRFAGSFSISVYHIRMTFMMTLHYIKLQAYLEIQEKRLSMLQRRPIQSARQETFLAFT